MTTRTFLMKMVLTTVLLVGASAQAFGFPFTVKDDRNKEITIAARPQRIISLAPTNTELLFALGLDKQVVGVTRYCDYPAAAKQKEKVGGFVDVDIDRIAQLKPDLILAFGTMQLPVVAELEKKGFTVFWLYPRTVDQVLDSFLRVGRITGREAEAKKLREVEAGEIAALRTAFTGLPPEKRPTVFRVMSFNSAATIGADSFQSDLFFVAGGRNTFPELGADYLELSPKQLVKGDPWMLLVCGEDEKAITARMKESPIYRDLTAVKQGRILVLPCELTCRPGPRIGEMARKLARYLHPEIDGSRGKQDLPQNRGAGH